MHILGNSFWSIKVLNFEGHEARSEVANLVAPLCQDKQPEQPLPCAVQMLEHLPPPIFQPI